MKRVCLYLTVAAILGLAGVPSWARDCAPIPGGIVSWWPGEGDATDIIDDNSGDVVGNVAFDVGMVRQAFRFKGSDQGVRVGNPANLQLQSFTIEGWIKRASPKQATLDPVEGPGGVLFAYGEGGYGFGLFDEGTLFLTQIGTSFTASDQSVTDLDFHHVAVTESDGAVVFYVDGVSSTAPAYDPGFTFDTPATIGARGDRDMVRNTFFGIIDEISIYNRALDPEEIQAIFSAGSAGKCLPQ